MNVEMASITPFLCLRISPSHISLKTRVAVCQRSSSTRSTYISVRCRGIEGSNMDEGQPKSWPELVGIPGTEAREKILAEDPTLQVGIVRPGMMVTMDYRLNRVRIYVDKDGIHDISPPQAPFKSPCPFTHRSLPGRVKFPNFQSTDLLHLFGSAISYHRKAVRLTSAEHSAGAAILRTPIVLLDRPGNSANSSTCRALAWSSIFDFRVSGPADGFAMVLWPRLRNLGSADGYMGYAGDVRYRRSRALAIEFDTYHNTWDPKPSYSANGADGGSRGALVASHVGINLRNSARSLSAETLVAPLNDTKIWRAWVIYNGLDLAVYVGRGRKRPRRAMMRGRMNLCAVLKKPGFFVGFTASSAGSPAVHDILSWTFSVSCEFGLCLPGVASRGLSTGLRNEGSQAMRA
ncbi:unnamed protein product [Closterium sp. Naga37s-1]|nr:unnamed protein product [Closterium sp. Naga37s-1]